MGLSSAVAVMQRAQNRNDWDLSWYLKSRIYTSIPTWTHLLNSEAIAEA